MFSSKRSSSCQHDGDAPSRLDRWGMLLSGACAVHCIAGLALVGVLGLGVPWLLAPEIHEYGLVAAIVIGLATIGIGVLRHRQWLPLVLGMGGIALMTLAVIGPHGTSEAVLTVSGVAILALGHWLNMRACQTHC